MSSMDLHIFFFPFPAPGHMIPMVDLAKIFAGRGVKATIVTTTGNAPLIQPTIARSSHFISLLTLHLSSPVENLMALPTPDIPPDFIAALNTLKAPFQDLVNQHHPDFVVSDMLYPWSADLGVERLVFHGTGAFCSVVCGAIGMLKLAGTVTDDNEPFVVPRMPHRVEMTRSQLTVALTRPSDFSKSLGASARRSYGMVLNTVYELEAEYVSMMTTKTKTWSVGPVSLCNRDGGDKAVRGGGSGGNFERCLNWLDEQGPGSVLYASFGSLGRFTRAQLRKIAEGLENSGHPFVWVMKDCEEKSEWKPEGFEDTVKGVIVTGWAPQILALNHEAVGGFMTHCGWNSCLEGLSAGLPMITWPLFAEQFFNEKLLVNVLRVGVSVGSKVCSNDEKKRTFVRGEDVTNAVKELMGSGDEADERRKRAKAAGETAKKAAEEGGSSYNSMSSLIQELMDHKAGYKPTVEPGKNLAQS